MEAEARTSKPVLSRKEAAAYLGIHVNTLDLNTSIPRVRIGGRTLFRVRTLDKYLADKEAQEGGTNCKKK